MSEERGRIRARIAHRLWPDQGLSWSGVRERVLPAAENLVRMTVGGVVAYLLTLAATDGPVDVPH